MVDFIYILKTEEGLHARPAGNFAKKAQSYPDDITIEKNGKTANAKRLFSLINLQINKGDTIAITVSGVQEQQTAKELQAYCDAVL